jgi:hypothetical protein
MSELTQDEKRSFSEFCDTVLGNPGAYAEICEYFVAKDSSFEYLFLFQRMKISSEMGTKALLKTAKEIRNELRAMSQNDGEPIMEAAQPRIGLPDFLGIRAFGDAPRQGI